MIKKYLLELQQVILVKTFEFFLFLSVLYVSCETGYAVAMNFCLYLKATPKRQSDHSGRTR